MSQVKIFKFLFLVIFSFPVVVLAAPDETCDPVVAKKVEKLNDECDKRKMKAKKQWPNLDVAQTEVLRSLKSGDAKGLAAYIGCDAGYSTKLEIHCEPELPEIGQPQLQEVIDVIKKSSPTVLRSGQWLNYGPGKDLYVYCSGEFKNVAPMNYCDKSGKVQPVVEIKRSGSQFYIFGLPEVTRK